MDISQTPEMKGSIRVRLNSEISRKDMLLLALMPQKTARRQVLRTIIPVVTKPLLRR